jgi:predicted nucleic acid-binding protein
VEPVDADALEPGSLVLVDSAPVIYTLDGNPKFARRFARVFERHAAGELVLAVTTITIAEVLTGPLAADDQALAGRYHAILNAWRVVELSSEIAASAARLRARYRLKLPDAVQVASALAIGADVLLTHDNDFAKINGLRVQG